MLKYVSVVALALLCTGCAHSSTSAANSNFVVPGKGGKPFSPFITTRTEIIGERSQLVPGIPAQEPGAPVVVLSCSLEYAKPLGTPDQSVHYHFAVYNQTTQLLRYVRIVDRYEFVAYQAAYIFDLKPHEYREVDLPPPPPSEGKSPVLLAPRRPRYLLCGAGPALAADGTVLDFLPGFLKK